MKDTRIVPPPSLLAATAFLLAMVWAGAAHASRVFPAVLIQASGWSCNSSPQCTVCHKDLNGGYGTVVTTFGVYLKDSLKVMGADTTSLRNALATDQTQGHVSNSNGIKDLDALKSCEDPNTAGNSGGTGSQIAPPAYGCGARITPRAPDGSRWAWPIIILAIVGMAFRRMKTNVLKDESIRERMAMAVCNHGIKGTRHSVKDYLGRTLSLLAAATCLGLACSADPGDPLKTPAAFSGSGVASGSGSAAATSGTGSGSGSGSGSSSGSSIGNSGASSSGSGSGGGGGMSSSGSMTDSGGKVDDGGIVPVGGGSCMTASCALKLQYWPTQMTTNSISPSIQITTTMPGVDLANITIHYYYRADGDTSPQYECDDARFLNGGVQIPNTSVKGRFVSMGASATPYADTYLEVSFPSAVFAVPSTGTGVGSTFKFNSRIHNTNYAVNYDQTKHWSYLSYTPLSFTSQTYVDATNVTAYLNGVLAWGVEPGNASDAGPAPVGEAGGGG